MKTHIALRLLAATFLAVSCSNGTRSSHLERAEEYSRKGQFDHAIEEYRDHMETRLDADRPEWENPYFYLILIGDIQLGQNKPVEALSTFEEADNKGVDKYLVSDRIRSTARWYEQHDQLDDAIRVLSKFRDRDDLLFDAMLDRISKELVRREDSQSPGQRTQDRGADSPRSSD